MRSRTFYWLGQQFVELMAEARPDLGPAEATSALFGQFQQELATSGLGLEHTVRTRLYGRTRTDRDGGSGERFKLLSGKARLASSSYIAPQMFDSDASI